MVTEADMVVGLFLTVFRKKQRVVITTIRYFRDKSASMFTS